MSPGVPLQMPVGPSKTAVPLVTSRSIQSSMAVGFVSGVGVRCVSFCNGGDGVFCWMSGSIACSVATLSEVSCLVAISSALRSGEVAAAVGAGTVSGVGAGEV
jgi:hypothetical protein